MKPGTRTQILVTSLSLFNARGESRTSLNAIADAADISPGNLHYHFRKKSDIVEALLAEFTADIRRVLEPPTNEDITIDDFWIFLHLLVEVTAVYRFLIRDMETLIDAYPKAGRVMRRFATALVAATHYYLDRLNSTGVLTINEDRAPAVSRDIVILVLFSERFDAISEDSISADDAGLRIARSVLSVLLPYASKDSAPLLIDLADRYMH